MSGTDSTSLPVVEKSTRDEDDHNERPSHEKSTGGVGESVENETSPPQVIEKPFSIYTLHEKWGIVAMASLAGIFSPLTANIYFPAIPTLSIAFHKSVEAINLTVTMYMVLQGVAPMVWGPLGDRWGRRPIILACLILLALSCVGLALVPTNAYWLLMLLRCLQAAGSASTIALGAGVIGDISTRAERGGFFSFYTMGPVFGPCIGPVVGGALANGLGWRSIFWFLCIGTALCAVAMLLFLPETLRTIVGDGSVKPHPFYRPLIPIIGRKRAVNVEQELPVPKPFTFPLRILIYPDIAMILIYIAVPYSVFYGVTASISTLFNEIYPFLSELEIGLCFLAIGGGLIMGGWWSGRALDGDYQKVKREMEEKARNDPEGKVRPEDVTKDENFPIEYARFRTMPVYFVVSVISCIGYGWCLEKKVNIAGPLILQVIIGFSMNVMMNMSQTLLIDLLPDRSGSVTACNNLVRCSLGATCVSVIDLIIKAIGVGWTYVLLSGLCVAVGPFIFIVMRTGPKWRAKRRAEQARRLS